MKNIANFTNKKVVLGFGLLAAVIMCSATTAMVVASGNSSDYVNTSGQIRSCRNDSSGNIRIIDNSTTDCSNNETGVNWSQSGGPTIFDANGQILGNLIDSRSGDGTPLVVYNPTLKRIINIAYSDAGHYVIESAGNPMYFESDDCTGQPYTYNDPHAGLKTVVLRVGDSDYGVVADSSTPSTKTIGSLQQYDTATDTFSCNDVTDYSETVYPIDSVSLPFSMPLASPLKF